MSLSFGSPFANIIDAVFFIGLVGLAAKAIWNATHKMQATRAAWRQVGLIGIPVFALGILATSIWIQSPALQIIYSPGTRFALVWSMVAMVLNSAVLAWMAGQSPIAVHVRKRIRRIFLMPPPNDLYH